jgi:lipopolysaccharide export system protein LptA
MPLSVIQLRRWLAIAAIAVVAIVAGAYFYARHRVENALKEVPGKIGLDIQQSANGFSISRSEQGRTLFKLQADKAVKFKQGGHVELHEVSITLYGRDSSRFDQIYGSDFEYDPESSQVSAKGEVQIDLEANPAGLRSPDQTQPRELKNPIHLKTSELVFSQKTGDAFTDQPVEFHTPQLSGSALGISYTAKSRTLTLRSAIRLAMAGPRPVKITAERGEVSKTPRSIVLENVHVQGSEQTAEAKRAELFLHPDNTVDRLLASGDVRIVSSGPQGLQLRADQMELTPGAQPNTIRAAALAGNVQWQNSAAEPVEGHAGRAVLDFAPGNVLRRVHAGDNVVLHQEQKSGANSQQLELTSTALDLVVAGGNRLQRAETAGGAQITLSPGAPGQPHTVITAEKFEAGFDSAGQLAEVHGSPDARIVNQALGHPERVSTSRSLEAAFHHGRIEALLQQGEVAYSDGQLRAFADQARYTPADQLVTLTGEPRIVEGGLTTTARTMRVNRQSGDALAEGHVKSTYADLKPQPGGAMLSSSSPIHVTANQMAIHRQSATAIYSGNVRLWQDANIVEAPVIEFDRDRRSILAHGSADGSRGAVSTVLVQADRGGKVTPVKISSGRLTYVDAERRARFDEGVELKAADFMLTAAQMDLFLVAQSAAGGAAAAPDTSRLDRIVAEGKVVIKQPARRATGERLEYTPGQDKFVLSGGSPSIFDAEHGKITGDSLTLFRADDRVLVEGTVTSPSVTQTRVAR